MSLDTNTSEDIIRHCLKKASSKWLVKCRQLTMVTQNVLLNTSRVTAVLSAEVMTLGPGRI